MESTPVGILRKTPSKRRPISDVIHSVHGPLGSPTSALGGVHFEAPTNIQQLLQKASDKKGTDLKANAELEGLITHMRNLKGQQLVAWIQELVQNISLLKPRMEYFVLPVLRIGWADQDKLVVMAYRDFLVNLVTAQGYYTKPVVKMLLCNLIGVANKAALIASTVGVDFDAVEARVFENTHDTLKVILQITPLAGKEALLKYAKESLPFGLSPDTHAHSNYISNILKITSYAGDERQYLLTLVIDRLVQLDAHLDKEMIEENEATEEVSDVDFRKSPHLIAQANLDQGMSILVSHIDQNSADDNLKPLYFNLLKAFETYVLTAHTGHVQFVMFYILAKNPALAAHFLDFLWKKFQSPNTPSVIRQTTMCYIASLVSRAKFVNVSGLVACLEKVTSWIHAYINSSSSGVTAMSGAALAAHGPFYAACQAVFYMFAFRHEELTTSRKHLAFLRTLHFNTIVTSRLNPLYFCLFQVVRNFSAISRNYQLAYCETIIQRNSRISLPVVANAQMALSSRKAAATETNNLLDAFFPFDPYRLPTSKHHFQEFFREYQGAVVDDSSSSESDDDDESGESEVEEDVNEIEDFLMQVEGMDTPSRPPKRRRTESTRSIGSIDFAYGTSPGFRH